MPKPDWFLRSTTYWSAMPKPIRQVLAASVGVTVLMIGVALLVLPGPGIVVILVGLAILATEFSWAQRRLHQVKHHGNKLTQVVTRRRKSSTTQEGNTSHE
jgi:tellurite resistance protein TerC